MDEIKNSNSLNQKGYFHVAVLSILFLAMIIIVFAGYRVKLHTNNKIEKPTLKSTSVAPSLVSNSDNKNTKEAVFVEPTLSAAIPTGSPSPTKNIASSEPQPTIFKPTKARIALVSGQFIEVPLNKGGDFTKGYFVQTCTKGGPGSEENKPIITIKTSVGDIPVMICKYNVFPTTVPRQGFARLELADGAGVEFSTENAVPLDGYMPASCSSGATLGAVIQVQTVVDYRSIQLCSNYKFAVTEI